jgi:hypothetical protein
VYTTVVETLRLMWADVANGEHFSPPSHQNNVAAADLVSNGAAFDEVRHRYYLDKGSVSAALRLHR